MRYRFKCGILVIHSVQARKTRGFVPVRRGKRGVSFRIGAVNLWREKRQPAGLFGNAGMGVDAAGPARAHAGLGAEAPVPCGALCARWSCPWPDCSARPLGLSFSQHARWRITAIGQPDAALPVRMRLGQAVLPSAEMRNNFFARGVYMVLSVSVSLCFRKPNPYGRHDPRDVPSRLAPHPVVNMDRVSKGRREHRVHTELHRAGLRGRHETGFD